MNYPVKNFFDRILILVGTLNISFSDFPVVILNIPKENYRLQRKYFIFVRVIKLRSTYF